MRSRSGRSTGPRRDGGRRRSAVDVYLFPAVVGGGLGDIEEVLAAGRTLGRAGFPLYLYRRPGHPLPRSVEGPWAWPRLEPCDAPARAEAAALTVAAAWGVSAAPSRSEAFGRGGPWEVEANDIETAYGAGSTLHVSLEEFARTFSPAAENRERLREGGVPSRELGRRLAASRRAGDVDTFRAAFVRYRAFDRPNVLHLFAAFRPDPAFSRAFPAAVQTGPLWPGRFRRRSAHGRSRAREWVWYASPASAERIAREVADGLGRARPPVRLFVRSPRPWRTTLPAGFGEVGVGTVPPAAWARRFAAAELRIVTGSRTLLEAIEVGGPFLYFNGVLGVGRRQRRHRPEKADALLEVLRTARVPRSLRRDLADFARGRRVAEVVRNAAGRRDGWANFPGHLRASGFRPPYDDAGRLLVAVARDLARTPTGAAEVVARARSGSIL
jgi:hypothetical protein